MSMEELTTLLGLGAAYMAYLSLRRHAIIYNALRRISKAPSVVTSDLRSVLIPDADGELIVVRGAVDYHPSSTELIIEGARTNLYSGLKELYGWKKSPTSREMPPLPNFILVDREQWPYSDHLVVSFEDLYSSIPKPNSDFSMFNLQIQPIDFSIGKFFNELFGLKCRHNVRLPRGEDVTVVGYGYATSVGDRMIFEIEPCEHLPYFVSNLTRDEMVADLRSAKNALVLVGVVFGGVAVGLLCYSGWRKWKAYLAEKAVEGGAEDDDDEN